MVDYLDLGAGITPDELRRVMIQYPSTAAVRQHKMVNGNLGVIQVSMVFEWLNQRHEKHLVALKRCRRSRNSWSTETRTCVKTLHSLWARCGAWI